MPYNDIQRLRQQYVFSPTADISGGDIDFGPPPIDYGEAPVGYDEGPPQPPDMPQQAAPGQAGMGAPPPITPPKAPSYDPNTSIQATIDAINRVYSPENVDRDRLRKLMDSYPERQAPSFGRSLVAAGLSLKAADPIATAEKVMSAPHLRDVADWKEKADPFYKTAQLENASNINERTLAGNVVTGVTAAERLAEQARQADQKNEVATQRNKINLIKANMGKGWQVIAHDVTTVRLYNQATGETKDTGIPTRWMNEEDKVDAEGQWKVDAAAASGQSALDRMTAAGGQVVQDTDGKFYVINPRTVPPSRTEIPGGPLPGATKLGPPRTAGAGNTLEKRRQQSDALKNVYQYDEENRRWIKKNNNDTYDFTNRPKVTPKGFFGGGEVTEADVKAYDEFRHSIDPSYTPPAPKPGGIGGSMGSGEEEPPKSKGLAPDTAPGAVVGSGPGGYTSSITVKPTRGDIELAPEQYRTFTDKTNPNNKRRTKDGGKTYEYSHDGGQTWGKR